MNKTKLLLTPLCLWLGMLPTLAQSVMIVEEMKQVPYASVMAMYKNEFGSFEKPVMSPSFPYAVIRMHLEGNAQAVRTAKERVTLYMGQQMGVESRVATYSNQILFLVRAPRHPMIYIDCGDGCERVLLSNMQQLQPNCLYDCKVRYVPEGETLSNIDAESLSNLETRLDSLQLVHKRTKESLQQAQLAAQEKPLIIRHSKYDQNLYGIEEYSYGETQMDKKALQLFLQENSPAAYKKYMANQKLITAGWTTFGIGTGVMLSSPFAVIVYLKHSSDWQDKRSRAAWAYWISALGAGGLVVGAVAIPLLSVGYHRQNHAYEIYNYEQKKKQPQLSLGVQASQNGIGLALSF